MSLRAAPEDVGVIHFVGIGGIGMSGIAEVLCALGYRVQGSDVSENANTARLADKGARIFKGHAAEHVDDADGNPVAVVVLSSAIKSDNPELLVARARKIPVITRADMLAELMRLKRAVAVGGTHGKTTTTSMVGAMLEAGGLDPTVINGGIVNAYGTNTRLGQSEWMVVEADESDGSFTRLPASIAVVTNIDPEHLDHYGDYDGVRDAFRRFVENVPFYGYAVLCLDHPEVRSLVARTTDRRVVTYGFNPQADIRCTDLRTEKGESRFDVAISDFIRRDGGPETIENIALPMLGRHNVQNALAAIAIGLEYDFPVATIRKALENFTGVKRRFTRTGTVGGVTIIDDYGHHPVEIEAVLSAARIAVEETGGRILAVMQPHRYTRLHDLMDEFCTCFHEADTVLVADVYPAGEAPIDGADKEHLVAGMCRHGHRDARILESPDALAEKIADIARPGDYVVCLGAGNITKWAHDLPGQLEALTKT